MKNMKLFIAFALTLMLVVGYKVYEQYRQLHQVESIIVKNESESISEFVKAFRQTYQDVFIQHQIKIDEKTINFLPVKTIADISKNFSHNVNSDITVRTVSDRPRNIKNMANKFELEMIQYFRDNPDEEEKFVYKEDGYHYAVPMLIKPSCLSCHGQREQTIPSVRDRYENAYDYKVGDVRGLLNIKVKEKGYFDLLYKDFTDMLVGSVILYFILLLLVYLLIRKVQEKEILYREHLERDIARKTKQVKQQKETFEYQAHHDALTGLPNRVLFADRLAHGIEQAKRHKTKLALFFVDLDHFKQINDSLGHDIGDKVLVAVTERLKAKIRQEDTLARLGGDEFTIIMEDLKQVQDAAILARKILTVLSQPIHIEGHTLYISCSIGISFYPQDGKRVSDLLKYADTAMYKAKEEGRNNFQFYSYEMTEMAFERMNMESNLRQALQKKEFILCYQPQIDTKNDEVVGLEALVRWNHPMMGVVPPEKFIFLAEELGLIIDIDQWVMKTAMQQISKWYKEGLNPGILSLNLSLKQLRSDGFLEVLKETMRENDFKPEWLELEVTEQQIMEKPEASIAKLQEISRLGIEIAIDDFGTGYSSLAYLKLLPVDKLKIDRSFIKDIPHDNDDVAIVEATIALAKSLGLNIIAEGVETKEQKEFLIKHGCRYMQGFYTGKPMLSEELEKVVFKDDRP